MTPSIPAQDLLFEVDVQLLERLMKRTKTGAEITGRQLAAQAGIASGTISNLLTGVRSRVTGPTVASICDVIGVELLVLGTPVERLDPATERLAELSAA